MTRSLLEAIRNRMVNGEFYCFGNPIDCPDAISDNPKCPLYESCLARFSELLKWEAKVDQELKEIMEEGGRWSTLAR